MAATSSDAALAEEKYDELKTESVFSGLREKTREIGIGTFFFKCTKLGIIPDCVAHYECIPFPVEVFPAKEKYEAELLKTDKKRTKPLSPPECRQYILDDFTPESIVRIHKANPRALIVFQDELMGFISSFNKYRSGSDEQMWTQLFAGRGVMVNRVSTDPVKINDTCIGILGGIQPQMLREFARGKVQNGFMDRWLLSYPEKVKYPKLNDQDISPQIRKNWRAIVNRILAIPYEDESRIIHLSREAKRIYKEWYDNLADQKNNGSLAFAGMATKMEPYCGRLALGLEIARGIGMGERTFKRWLQTNAFKKISYGFYEKRFR